MYLCIKLESMLNILTKHRSIRKYTGATISDDMLDRILEAGCRASTTGNMQVYSIVVNRSAEMKKKLAGCHFNQPMVEKAPVVLTFCADFNRFNLWCRQNNAEPGYDNFLSFFTAAIDALLVAQNVCIAAESEGLGICYLGTTTYLAGKIIEVLGLPAGVVPVTTVTMGWPAENPMLADRLGLDAIVHRETYKNFSKEDITRLYAAREALPENRKFVEENQKKSLAQVFTDVRYKKTDNELFSGMLLDVLKKQGFIN